MPVGEVNSVGGGYFEVDGQKMNLTSMYNAVMLANMDALEGVQADYLTSINDATKQMEAMTQMLEEARKRKANKSKTNDDNAQGSTFKLDAYPDAGSKNFTQWMNYLGIEEVDVNPNDKKDEWESEWDMNIENIKGQLDLVQSRADTDTYKAKDLQNRRNNNLMEANKQQDQFYQATSRILQ